MVAVVESKDGVAVCVEKFAGAQHIGGVGTALPAVQEHDDAFRLRVRRVEALQGDVWNGVEQHFAGGVEHGVVSPCAEFVAGKQGLHEGVAEIEGRVEGLAHKAGILSVDERGCQLFILVQRSLSLLNHFHVQCT